MARKDKEWPLRCPLPLEAAQELLIPFLSSVRGYDDASVAAALQKGNQFFQQKDFSQARDHFGVAYEIGRHHCVYRPLLHDLLLRRVLCHSLLGNFEVALQECQKADWLIPNEANSKLILAVIYAKLGRVEANVAFQQAVASQRELRDLVDCLIAFFCLHHEHADIAITICTKVLKRSPRFPLALLMRGDAYLCGGVAANKQRASADHASLLELDNSYQALISRNHPSAAHHSRAEELLLSFHPCLQMQAPKPYSEYALCRRKDPLVVASLVILAVTKLRLMASSGKVVRSVQEAYRELLEQRAQLQRKVQNLLHSQSFPSPLAGQVYGPMDPDQPHIRRYRRYWMEQTRPSRPQETPREVTTPREALLLAQQEVEASWSASAPQVPSQQRVAQMPPAQPLQPVAAQPVDEPRAAPPQPVRRTQPAQPALPGQPPQSRHPEPPQRLYQRLQLLQQNQQCQPEKPEGQPPQPQQRQPQPQQQQQAQQPPRQDQPSQQPPQPQTRPQPPVQPPQSQQPVPRLAHQPFQPEAQYYTPQEPRALHPPRPLEAPQAPPAPPQAPQQAQRTAYPSRQPEVAELQLPQQMPADRRSAEEFNARQSSPSPFTVEVVPSEHVEPPLRTQSTVSAEADDAMPVVPPRPSPPRKVCMTGEGWEDEQWLTRAKELLRTFGVDVQPPEMMARATDTKVLMEGPCKSRLQKLDLHGWKAFEDWYTPLDQIYKVRDMAICHASIEGPAAVGGLLGAPGHSYVVPAKRASSRKELAEEKQYASPRKPPGAFRRIRSRK
ncbi:unnamed protein product [Effrenium voratum]|nr:unnamed protein product [Effrenium voratum]